MPTRKPKIPATTPPTTKASSSAAGLGKVVSYRLTHTSVPAKAPTLINPAWPRLSSPSMPTVRFRETAMTTYAQIGTS